MPDSLISQLVNNAWDEISQAVSVGLAFGNRKALSDIITVSTKQVSATTWQFRMYEPADRGRRCVRRSATSAAFDYRYRFPLGYDELRILNGDSVQEWAASVRAFELHHVVGRLADAAGRRDFTAGNLRAAQPEGWGQLRCLTFNETPGEVPVPDNLMSLGWDGPVKLDMPSPKPPIQALLFRLGGGPYLQRPADLTLGWMPGTDDGVELVLTEQIQLVNATVRTIIGIRMVEQ
jgi:hypothetical protein